MSVVENLEMGAYQRKSGNKKKMLHVFELFPVLAERRKQDGPAAATCWRPVRLS